MKFLLTDIIKGENPNITADNLVRIPDEISLDGVALESWVNGNFDNYNYFNLQTNGIQRQKVGSENILNITGNANTGITYENGVVSINTFNTQLTDAQVKSIINTVGYLKLVDLNGYALESWVNNNFDNYNKWNLKLNGVQKTTIQSNGILDLIQGSNVNLSYSAGGKITIDVTDTNDNTEYTQGIGIAINGQNVISNTITNNNQLTNGKGYITSYTDTNTQLTDAQVKTIIATVGYLKLVDLNGYATENYVNNQGFITSYTDTNTQLTDAQVKTIIATVGYLTSHQSITGKADKSTNINTSLGITGGGNLSQDRDIQLTESTLESLGIARSAIQPEDLNYFEPSTLLNDYNFTQDNKLRIINIPSSDLPLNYGNSDIKDWFNLNGLTIGDKEIIAWQVSGIDCDVVITNPSSNSIYNEGDNINITADINCTTNSNISELKGFISGLGKGNHNNLNINNIFSFPENEDIDLNGYALDSDVIHKTGDEDKTGSLFIKNDQFKELGVKRAGGLFSMGMSSGGSYGILKFNDGTNQNTVTIALDGLSANKFITPSGNSDDWNAMLISKADKFTVINTSNGIEGGGTLANDRTIKLTQGTLDNLAKADSAIQEEVDPIFQASPASDVTNDDISNYRDNFEYSRKKVEIQIVTNTSFYTLKDLVTNQDLQSTSNNKMYVIKMGTLGTGSITGNAYLLYPSRSDDGWNIRKLNVMSESSSNGALFLDNGVPKIKTFVSQNYNVKIFIEEYDISNKNIQTGVMGSETSFAVEGILKSHLDHDIYAYDNYDNRARMWTNQDFSLNDLNGGSGTTYTAGSGIDISNSNVISTEVTLDIPDKLTVRETGDYTVTATDKTIVHKVTDDTQFTFNIPTASSSKDRVLRFVIWYSSGGSIIFNFNRAIYNTRGNAVNGTIKQGVAVLIQSDGTNWYQIN